MKFLFDTCSNMFGLNGPANLPSYLFFNSCVPSYVFIDGTPSDGVTYVLNPPGIGINETEEGGYKVFPNPSSKFLKIKQFENPNGILKINILDPMGKIIMPVENYEVNYNEIIIPIDGLSNGLYFLNIYRRKGIVQIQKFVKKSS